MTAEQYSILVAALNVWFVLLTIPNNSRIFSSVVSNGYIESGSRRPFLRLTRNFAWGLSIAWLVAAILMVFSLLPIAASIFSFGISYYFFIFKRYESLSRGLGAPGYFITWINFTNCTYLIVNRIQSESIEFLSKFFLAEIGIVFLVSGLYKLTSGYQRGRGMNVGMCNPQWSYFPLAWKGFNQNAFQTSILNGIAVYGEIVGGIFLLSFKLQHIGSFIIATMFLGVAVTVRLGNLCFLIICSVICPLLIKGGTPQGSSLVQASLFQSFVVLVFFTSMLAYIGLAINYYTNLTIPKNIQTTLNRHVRVFGTSLWRVFTADITSIYIEIFSLTEAGGMSLISKWTDKRCKRFRFVGEAITITSIFTLLKYQADRRLFESRLIAHARSLNLVETKVCYRYFYIDTRERVNSLQHVRDFFVDLESSVIRELKIDVNFDPTAPEEFSRTVARPTYGYFS